VAAVCTDGAEEPALQHLERLAEASLVSVDAGEEPTRYRVLETVRQYGAELLAEVGEADAVRWRHAGHFTAVAEAAWHPLRTQGVVIQAAWLERLLRDRENLRAALAWLHDARDHESILRIAEALWWFWWIRGEVSEGRSWLTIGLEHATTADASLRAHAHLGLGGLSWAQADLDAAEEHAAAAQVLFAEIGNAVQEGSAFNTLGLIAEGRQDFLRARTLFESALARYRTAQDAEPARITRSIAVAVDNLGTVSLELGQRGEALALYREALEINRSRGDDEGIAMNELHIAMVEAEAGRLDTARLDAARVLLSRALAVYQRLGFHQYAAECLEVAAVIANGTQRAESAAFLLGVAAREREAAGAPPVPVLARLREREQGAAIAAIGAEVYAEIAGGAERLPSDVALDQARAFLEQPVSA
jgi:tetratricopeptide (TPR) repeat protein